MHGSADDNMRNRQNNILRYDVGVDANNFYPVSIEEILEYFKLAGE